MGTEWDVPTVVRSNTGTFIGQPPTREPARWQGGKHVRAVVRLLHALELASDVDRAVVIGQQLDAFEQLMMRTSQ